MHSDSTKYIVVIGGVMSGVGKGLATAAIAKILTEYGFSVTTIKIDPYISIDAGLFRPTEHGEVWVTADGGEIDQDLGNYERFLGRNLSRAHNITTGQIYKTVIEKERRGEFLGVTVELIPHITDEIKHRITTVSEGYDICLVEIGGTVGEYQNVPFLFAMKSLQIEIGTPNMIYVLITYLPIPSHIEEMKTKPTQQAIRLLSEHAIFPDLILCRSKMPLDLIRKRKIQTYANISADYVISAPDTTNLYSIPLNFENEGIGAKIMSKLGLSKRRNPDWSRWEEYTSTIDNPGRRIRIAIVNKYVETGAFRLADCYISVQQALVHAGAELNVGVDIDWVNANDMEGTPEPAALLADYSGILVPGAFGDQGFNGMLETVRFAREQNVPYLGLCFGMHMAVCEIARNVCGLEDASTTEIHPDTAHPVISILEVQKNKLAKQGYGGTMRLGAYAAILKEGTEIHRMYSEAGRVEADAPFLVEWGTGTAQHFRLGKLEGNETVVTERHRHRYEVNPEYLDALAGGGIVFSGCHIRDDGTRLMEFMELPDNRCFIATQAHPEFCSRLGRASPMFLYFVSKAAEFAGRR